MSTESKEDEELWYHSNSTPMVSQMLPLLTQNQAKNWENLFDDFKPDDAAIWIPCPVMHGQKTFALTVTDNSMFHPDQLPFFAIGDFIFVDPDVKPAIDSIILVKTDTDQLLIRQMTSGADGKMRLKAINPNWEETLFELTPQVKICGTIISKVSS